MYNIIFYIHQKQVAQAKTHISTNDDQISGPIYWIELANKMFKTCNMIPKSMPHSSRYYQWETYVPNLELSITGNLYDNS